MSGGECGSNPARPGTWQTSRTGPAFPGVRQTLVEGVPGHQTRPPGQAHQNLCLGEMLIGSTPCVHEFKRVSLSDMVVLESLHPHLTTTTDFPIQHS